MWRTASRNERQPSSTWATSSERFIRAARSEVAGIVVFAIRLLQHLHLLADGRHRARTLDERGHELAMGLRRRAQPVHGLAPAAGVALRSHVVDELELFALDIGIDSEHRDLLGRLAVGVLV